MLRDKSSGFRSSSRSADPGATGDVDKLSEKKSNRAMALASPSCDMMRDLNCSVNCGAAGAAARRAARAARTVERPAVN